MEQTGRDRRETQAEAPAHQAQPQLQPLPPSFEKRALQTQQYQQPAPQFVQYASFQPPPGVAEQVEQKSQKPRPWSRQWHLAKVALGTASIVTSVILWAISIALLAKFGGAYPYDYFDVTFEAGFALGVGGVAVIWITAEFITIWASKTNYGITPGAHVGLHLVICMVAGIGTGFNATFLAWDIMSLNDYDDSDSSTYYGSYSEIGYDGLSTMIRLLEALVAFMGLLVLIHFVLFIRACVETKHYNAWKRSAIGTRTVYVHVPVPMAPGQQPYDYYTSMPGQQAMMIPQPTQQMTQGSPAPPGQAHVYGYYAPGSGSAPASGPIHQTQHAQQAPPPRTVSPMASGSQ